MSFFLAKTFPHSMERHSHNLAAGVPVNIAMYVIYSPFSRQLIVSCSGQLISETNRCAGAPISDRQHVTFALHGMP